MAEACTCRGARAAAVAGAHEREAGDHGVCSAAEACLQAARASRERQPVAVVEAEHARGAAVVLHLQPLEMPRLCLTRMADDDVRHLPERITLHYQSPCS